MHIPGQCSGGRRRWGRRDMHTRGPPAPLEREHTGPFSTSRASLAMAAGQGMARLRAGSAAQVREPRLSATHPLVMLVPFADSNSWNCTRTPPETTALLHSSAQYDSVPFTKALTMYTCERGKLGGSQCSRTHEVEEGGLSLGTLQQRPTLRTVDCRGTSLAHRRNRAASATRTAMCALPPPPPYVLQGHEFASTHGL